MQTLAFIRKQLSLSRQELLQLRAFQPLPGVYTMNETPYKSRIKIVSTQQAVSVLKREMIRNKLWYLDQVMDRLLDSILWHHVLFRT